MAGLDEVVQRILNAVYGDPQAGITDDGDKRFRREVASILEEECPTLKMPEMGAAAESRQPSQESPQSMH